MKRSAQIKDHYSAHEQFSSAEYQVQPGRMLHCESQQSEDLLKLQKQATTAKTH